MHADSAQSDQPRACKVFLMGCSALPCMTSSHKSIYIKLKKSGLQIIIKTLDFYASATSFYKQKRLHQKWAALF
jgi:hypothetical protein